MDIIFDSQANSRMSERIFLHDGNNVTATTFQHFPAIIFRRAKVANLRKRVGRPIES